MSATSKKLGELIQTGLRCSSHDEYTGWWQRTSIFLKTAGIVKSTVRFKMAGAGKRNWARGRDRMVGMLEGIHAGLDDVDDDESLSVAPAASPPSAHDPEEHAEMDDLLPLLRRRLFDQDLERFGRSASEQEPLSLVILDLDHFKKVNDTHGHPVGDEVLIECANIVGQRCRKKGKAYRFGGEEIAALLPNFTTGEAVALAESIRSDIEKNRVSSKKLSVTVSIGVATAPAHGAEVKQLLKAADKALYTAKHEGRNSVRIASEDSPAPVGKAWRRAEPAEGQPLEMTLSHERLTFGGDRHNYRLAVTLKNTGRAVIDDYQVDVLFPTGLLRKDLTHPLEVPSQRTASHSLFRVSTDTRQLNTLRPGDSVITITVNYYVDRDIFHYQHGLLEQNVVVTLHVRNSPPVTVQKSVSELQEF